MSAICTVALYGPKLDCSTIWQGPHKTSPRPLEYMVLSLPTVLTLCNTLNSSSKFNQHTFYHFWVQMAAGSPREDIYGHIQRPFHSESPVWRPSQASFRGCWRDGEEAALWITITNKEHVELASYSHTSAERVQSLSSPSYVTQT